MGLVSGDILRGLEWVWRCKVQEMTKKGLLKRVWFRLTPQRLIVWVLFIAIFAMAIREAADPDMWWHLAAGRHLVEHRTMLYEDIFSYTKLGTRWHMHEWLTEVGMYLLYKLGGIPLLILFSAGIIMVSMLLVYVQCESRPYIAVFLILLGAVASAPLWGVRPQMLNVLFMALLTLWLERYRAGHNRVIWRFPVLMIFWCNMHAGFFLGLGLIAVILGGDAFARIFGFASERTLSWKAWRNLLISLGLCVLASLVNPNGHHMLLYSFDTLGSPTMQAYIHEWASPDFHRIEFWPFAALLLGGSFLLVIARKRMEFTDLVLFFGFGFAGLLSMRHISLFAVAGVPVVTRALADIKLFSFRGRNIPWLNWAVVALALVAVIFRFYDILGKNRAYEEEYYPVAALAFIEDQDLLDARIYNSYNWGGYLIWHRVPVYIDGRADVYGDDFINQYMLAYQLHGNWRVPLDKYDADYVLIESRASLGSLLEEAPEWEPVYEDEVAVVFVRQG